MLQLSRSRTERIKGKTTVSVFFRRSWFFISSIFFLLIFDIFVWDKYCSHRGDSGTSFVDEVATNLGRKSRCRLQAVSCNSHINQDTSKLVES